MVDYQLAHNLYCLVMGVDDTVEFLNAPKLLMILNSLDTMQSRQLKMYLRNKHLVSKEDIPQQLLYALREKIDCPTFSKEMSLSNIERERNLYRAENRALQRRMRELLNYIPKSELKKGETKIEDLGISRRTSNALHRAGFITINDVLKMHPDNIYRLRQQQFGMASAMELKVALMDAGFGEIDETRFCKSYQHNNGEKR